MHGIFNQSLSKDRQSSLTIFLIFNWWFRLETTQQEKEVSNAREPENDSQRGLHGCLRLLLVILKSDAALSILPIVIVGLRLLLPVSP